MTSLPTFSCENARTSSTCFACPPSTASSSVSASIRALSARASDSAFRYPGSVARARYVRLTRTSRMRPALADARTDPSSTHPGSRRNANTTGSVVTFADPSRVTSARSEKTVTFRIVEARLTVFGSSGSGATRLAGTETEPSRSPPGASTGFPPCRPHAVVASSAASGTHAHRPIVRLVCCIVVVLRSGRGFHRGARPRRRPDGRGRGSIYPAGRGDWLERRGERVSGSGHFAAPRGGFEVQRGGITARCGGFEGRRGGSMAGRGGIRARRGGSMAGRGGIRARCGGSTPRCRGFQRVVVGPGPGVAAPWRDVVGPWPGVAAPWRSVVAPWRDVVGPWPGVVAPWRDVVAPWPGVAAPWPGVAAPWPGVAAPWPDVVSP